jgi:TetR/AcrR family transcriptional regulator, transcriptional repressor for nem operon
MARDTSKKTILREGARLIHAKGFNKTGLQEILNAAQIPKGSFYFYFKSKDDFGLELVDYYWEFIEAMGEKYLSDSSIPPLERLSGFMDAYQSMFENMKMRCGCPIGNLMQEMSDLSKPFREKIGDIYARMHDHIARMLIEAKDQGELPAGMDPVSTAQFILNSWEGAIMHMKLVKNIEPLIIFKHMVFDHILKSCRSGTQKEITRHG